MSNGITAPIDQTLPELFAAVEDTILSDVALESIEDLLSESFELSIEAHQLHMEIRELLATYDDLKHLSLAIEQKGITQSLLTFVNQNNVLSNNIPAIPALEGFSADISVEDSQAALEGIVEILKTIYDKTIGRIAALVNHVITSIRIRFRSLPAIRVRVDGYTRDLSGKEFDEELASKTVGKFSQFKDLMELIEHTINADKVVVTLLQMHLPSTEDDFVKWKDSFEQFKRKQEPNYRISKSGFKYSVHSEASLSDNGYNAESFHDITAKIDEFVRKTLLTEAKTENAWNEFNNRADKLIKEQQTKSIVKEGDTYRTRTSYTRVGRMLIEATADITEVANDIYNRSYRDGVLNALKILNQLKKAYK